MAKTELRPLNTHIWEGWTIEDFINELEMEIDMIMTGNSFRKPFTNISELTIYCQENQPYYKKQIPEVVDYFATKYNIH